MKKGQFLKKKFLRRKRVNYLSFTEKLDQLEISLGLIPNLFLNAMLKLERLL